ncbi:MAG TPA: hypothetical protein VF516_17920 [Kofleriaceae bacterium]
MLGPTLYATLHFRLRAAERALPPDVEEFLRMWGTEIWAAGARQITVSLPELPAELRDTMIARRAQDWILVAAPSGALITCYHRRNAWRFITRKSEDRRRRVPRHRRSRRR